MASKHLAVAALLFVSTSALAQGPVIPPGDKEPMLRLEAQGPTSYVTALAFSPDGKRLYAAGFDKVVRVWALNAKNEFELDRAAYRVPIGPGIDGAINAVAISPDEKWLAVAGQGIVRGAADFRQPGLILPKTGSFTESMWKDQGTIYIFNLQTKEVRALRGHMGPVWSLAFAPLQKGKPMLLVSAGRDRDMETHTDQGSVRLWNVEAGTLAEERTDLPSRDSRPAVTVWHTGRENKQVLAALAWEDGALRLWNVENNKITSARDGWNGEKEGMHNNTAALVADREQLVTLSRRVARGVTPGAAQIQLWSVADKALQSEKIANFASEDGDFPRALTLVSSRAGGKPDLAAVVMVRVRGNSAEYLLDLVDLSPDNFGEVRSRVTLWEGGAKLPTLASAPGSSFLAVAGNKYHSIRIYSIRDLLEKKGEAEPKQVLMHVGRVQRFAAFVRKGNDRGLLLNKEPSPTRGGRPRDFQEGDVIFDLAQRRFTEELGEWKIDAPNLQGWKVVLERNEDGSVKQPFEFSVFKGEERKTVRKLWDRDTKEVVTDYALLPPMPPLNVPILAVAFHHMGEPWLELFNAETGDHVRRYTGHTERISSLAFSGDGRFLVSVAEDYTICVWSMSKLEKYLGKLGMLPGLAVRNRLSVAAVQKGGPAQGKLNEDDMIEGVVEDGKLRRFFSLRLLYSHIAQLKPGSAVTLQVRSFGADGPGQPRKVQLVVGREIVEQTRALLLGLNLTDPLAMTSLLPASQLYSNLPGASLKYVPTVVLDPEKRLAEDDVIEGIVEAGKVRPLASARDFYEAIALMKPGAQVNLRVRGKGNVALKVGQGSDERKPLFSLFISGGQKPAQWEWVGWSPIGPYEASDRKAERHIGWHFNTGDPKAPASFALADQYRKEYYREGILRQLIAKGDLAAALKDWEDQDMRRELSRPKLTLWIDEVGPDPQNRDPLGRVIARQTPAQIKLAIDDFPLDRVESVTWQVNGGPAVPFHQPTSAREHSAPLDLKRGVTQVRVVLRTYETQPQEFAQDLVVRFAPPAPVIKPQGAQRQAVNAAAFNLKAEIEQGRIDQDVQVRLVHSHREKKIRERDWLLEKGKNQEKPRTLAVEEKLELQPGDNLVEIVAVNKDASPDDAELETARFSWLITYVPPEVKVPPPRISIVQVTPVVEDEAVPPLSIEPGKPVVVHDPLIRVRGEIEGTDELVRADWKNKAGGGQLEGFVPNQKKLAVLQKLTLEPGTQTFSFQAKSAKSDPVEISLTVIYRPRLPGVLLTTPVQTYYDEGKGVPSAIVQGVFIPKNGAPVEATLLLDDQPVAKLPTDKPEWTSTVVLKQPGEHRIQVRLKNPWDMIYTSEPLTVRCVRPPCEIRFEQVPAQKEIETDKPLIDLTARMRSPLPLIRESVEAEVNGREIVAVELVPPADEKDKDIWGLRLKNVPLEPQKKNTIRLWVSNTEARCQTPGEATVVFVPPAEVPSRPEVELIDPMKDINSIEPQISVRFRVRSKGPLKRVDLVREGRSPLRESFPLADLKPDARGFYEFQKVLPLLPKENRLRVTALNEGGEHDALVVVNYLYMPVRLTIDHMEPLARGAKPLAPKVLPDGKFVFPPAPEGRMILQGRVAWSKDDDEQLKQISLVRIYVNGFQQIPAELRSPVGGARERLFRADLLLNRFDNNQIEIELPNLKQEASNRREFALTCEKPEPGQRLHLLIVGIGEKDERKLTDQALLALRASREKGQLKTPAFSQVRIYGPLTGFVSPEQVFTQLCLIKKTIDVLATEGSPNDVAMVYFQGAEAVKPEGNFLETSVSKYDKELRRSGITFKGLQGFFDETLGAKLLWLDVARTGDKEIVKDDVAKLAPNTYFSVLRYRWLNNGEARKTGGLLSDWKQAMDVDTAGVLKSVATEMTGILKQQPGVAYDRFIPTGLEALLVDRKEK